MAVQRHPIESFKKDLNFWEEFPDYKLHQTFGVFWKVNRKLGKLEESSLFMWALTLCYDRKSAFFNQPEIDKWGVVCEDLFKDEHFFTNLALEEEDENSQGLMFRLSFRDYIVEFEKTIDIPLGISLRNLERKLIQRTEFIQNTPYVLDYYEIVMGKKVIRKGTVTQIDKMFVDTGKINDLIQGAIDKLKASERGGQLKGGGQGSLGDEDESF